MNDREHQWAIRVHETIAKRSGCQFDFYEDGWVWVLPVSKQRLSIATTQKELVNHADKIYRWIDIIPILEGFWTVGTLQRIYNITRRCI